MARTRAGRRRRLTALLALMVAVLAACSVEEQLSAPDCRNGDSTMIVAQSVPPADLVPCLDRLPLGWTVSGVIIDQDGTDIGMDSDRAGFGAARLSFRESCDAGEAVSVPSDQPGADAFEFIERVAGGFRADRFYQFPGGCVRWRFDFDAEASATLSIELQDRLTLVPRTVLNDSIRDSFVDEEL